MGFSKRWANPNPPAVPMKTLCTEDYLCLLLLFYLKTENVQATAHLELCYLLETMTQDSTH